MASFGCSPIVLSTCFSPHSVVAITTRIICTLIMLFMHYIDAFITLFVIITVISGIILLCRCRSQLIILTISVSSKRCIAELLVNPGQNLSISCGEFEDCIIICNETSSCSNSIFSVINNAISIEFSAENACSNCDIITSNVQSLNLSSSATSAFSYGSFFCNNEDGKIIVDCSAHSSCAYGSFHFKGDKKAEMRCSAEYSCGYSTIRNANSEGLQLYSTANNAIGGGKFVSESMSGQSVIICGGTCPAMFHFNGKEPAMLKCEAPYSCAYCLINAITAIKIQEAAGIYGTFVMTSIIMPRDIVNHDLSEFNFTNLDIRLPVIYSFFHRNINFVGLHFGRIFYRNAVDFSDYCDDASDSICVENMNMINDSADNPMPFIIDTTVNESDVFPLDFSHHSLDEDALFIVADPYDVMSLSNVSTWLPPIFRNNKSFLSIITFDTKDILFDLHSTDHVTMIPLEQTITRHFRNVIGPKTTFVFYGGTVRNAWSVENSTYYLNETKSVIINADKGDTFYLGHNIDLVINCNNPYTWPFRFCRFIDIYTLLDPMNMTLQRNGWNIDCTYCGEEVYIHFLTINMTCEYSKDGPVSNECDFLSSAPTAAPSAAPSATPSTAAPTAPSAAPSTAAPTAPTAAPSTAPTAPSAAPSVAPSAVPSAAPSTAPSYAPTSCYGAITDEDEENLDQTVVNLSFSNFSSHSNKTLNITVTAQYAQLTIPTTDIETILCIGLVSCLQSNIMMRNNAICNILCNAFMSCLGAIVDIEQCNHVHVICNGPQSCQNAQLTINSSEIVDGAVNIDCGKTSSCNSMSITIIGQNAQSNISCYEVNACDQLSVTVENYEISTLFMYSFSSHVMFDNLFGLGDPHSDTQYVVCNTEKKYVEWNKNMNSTQTSQLIVDEYIDGTFPCSDVTIQCKQNVSDTQSTKWCKMDYDIVETVNTPSSAPSDISCFWLSIEHIIDQQCKGECLSSPTKDPTTAPSAAPTEPSSNPTNAPSFAPTQYPSISPSVAPSSAPSFAPTQYPSISPSVAPSTAPTLVPSLSPTLAPTIPPTLAPSLNPSFSPSSAPVINPTMSPTPAPSSSPTVPPSAAPTRVPTNDIDDIYDAYINIQYRIEHLTKNNIYWIANNTLSVIHGIERIIESNYFVETLQYTEFWVQIQTVNDKEIEKLTIYDLDIVYLSEPMVLDATIKSDYAKAEFIKSQSGTESFEENNQQQFQFYFGNNTALSFEVIAPDKLEIQRQYTSKTDYTYVIVSAIIVSIGVLLSLFAYIFNKLRFTKVDNAAFYVPLLLSLGIYDFISDIIFDVNVFENANLQLNDEIFWIGICSALFTILPFSSNLYYAITINSQQSIQLSPSARNWFSNYLAPFIFFCIITAGTYPALLFCSSRLFGLELLNAGLLSTELHTLSIIKMRSTIYLENGPQLFLQILYSIFRDSIETETILAFIASSLSVVASVLIFKAQQNLNEQYIIRKYFIGIEKRNAVDFDDNERAFILFAKGLKDKMGKLLCQAFKTPAKAIEIGYVTLGINAFFIHIQHAIFRNDMDALKERLVTLQYHSTSGFDVQITPDLYIMTLFKEHSNDVNKAIAQHFKLTESEIKSSYHKRWADVKESSATQGSQAALLKHSQLAENETAIDGIANQIKKQHTKGFRDFETDYGVEEKDGDGLEMTLLRKKENPEMNQSIFDTLTTITKEITTINSKMDALSTINSKMDSLMQNQSK